MAEYKKVVTFEGCEYKTTSYYGNPSYWVWFHDEEEFEKGYTGSNCACGYGVRNYHEGDKVLMTYHYTKAGNCVITVMKNAE